ncbi:MAG: hypothetical protein J2P37_01235 [Ktedonobacteraceae bacterium]|nr:hypothetical protein [Ktedonobacteraceae bacterium]
MPTSEAQPSRFLPRRPQATPPSHSMSAVPVVPPPTTFPVTPLPSAAGTPSQKALHHEQALDFATRSWDLATGGLKTLTAKRELPTRADRRVPDIPQNLSSSRSYMFAMVILACVVLMLIGSAIVLFVMLQS